MDVRRIAIITARGGSKRIPKKNIREFNGKPILAYSVEAAVASGLFDTVMVSTDDAQIAEIAKQYGAQVPFYRSADTANDFATTNDVLAEVLGEYEKRGEIFDTAVCLYPTAPFVTADKLKTAVRRLEESDADTLIPVVAFSYPPQRAMIVRDERLVFEYPEYLDSRSQDLTPHYHDVGQFYVFRPEAFKRNRKLMVGNILPLIVSELEVQDIDNLTDWKIAEIKYELMQKKYRIREIQEKDNADVEKLIRYCLKEFGADHEGTAWMDPYLGRFSEVYASEGNRYWVAVDEQDKVVAGAGIGALEGCDGVCELQKMYCYPEARGVGIAKKLLDGALAYARDYYRECYLETLSNMSAAHRFYEKAGFTRTDKTYEQTGHYACDVKYIMTLVSQEAEREEALRTDSDQKAVADSHDTDSTKRKIALLSNINLNAVIRMLQDDADVFAAEGYGNELGQMMNPASAYNLFAPEITFVILDLLELCEHDLTETSVSEHIGRWLDSFESALKSDRVYYVSDAYIWGAETEVASAHADVRKPEEIWRARLGELCEAHDNIRIFPYRQLIAKLGEENAFSLKMWYMGKILHSMDAQKRMAELIRQKTELESRTPKKVLVLDLDNTLWGGLAGENDATPVKLSEDHAGLAYKNLQRVILQMQKQGVILAIASKNNLEDAMAILERHPHIVLRPEYFAAARINWNPKNVSLTELSEELNVGLDSFVFFDDNPQERLLITGLLPEVTVPDFPAKPEDLAAAMTEIYHRYFEKPALTNEDLEKTKQYQDNAKRAELKQSAGNFYDYLRDLKLVVTRVNTEKNLMRFEELVNKTNQFNLTTRRHDFGEIRKMAEDKTKRIYLYRVEDCFGDNGIVAAVVVDLNDEIPVVEEFVMSCRVMGKNVEYGIIKDVEMDMMDSGYEKLRGRFIPTAKNKPVEKLYETIGYHIVEEGGDGGKLYEITLKDTPTREFMGQVAMEDVPFFDLKDLGLV